MAKSRCPWILGLIGTVALAAGCATTPQDEVAARFEHRVPIETGRTEIVEGARLQIDEVWGTRPKIEVGGVYLLWGRYHLATGDAGMVFFHLTAEGWDNRGFDDDLQHLRVANGDGSFSLVSRVGGPGILHVELHKQSGGESTRVANVYFGTAGDEAESSRAAAAARKGP